MSKQKEAFIKYEADSWFKRNQNVILNYNENEDPVIQLIEKYNIKFESVLEIGASAGYRLQGIKNKFDIQYLLGVEPSIEAIKYGKKNFPSIKFINGTMDDLKSIKDSTIDLIIIGFVFYVVDRNLLYKCISEVDRVLKDKGKVVLIDFYSNTFIQKEYIHISDFSAYTYKNSYHKLFTSSGLYEVIDFSSFEHSTMVNSADCKSDDLVSISLMRKC